MATNYVQPGDVLTLTAPEGGVVSGTGYVVGGFFVVAMGDAEADEAFQGMVTGVHLLPKTTGQVWTEGVPLYWDAAPGALTSNEASGPFVGGATAAAGTNDTTGYCRLNGVCIVDAGES